MDNDFRCGFEKVAVSFKWIGNRIGGGLRSRAASGGLKKTPAQMDRIGALMKKKVDKSTANLKNPKAIKKVKKKQLKDALNGYAEKARTNMDFDSLVDRASGVKTKY